MLSVKTSLGQSWEQKSSDLQLIMVPRACWHHGGQEGPELHVPESLGSRSLDAEKRDTPTRSHHTLILLLTLT